MIGAHPSSAWGSGRGVLRRVTPAGRMLCWALLLITSCLTPAISAAGIGALTLVVTIWLLAALPRWTGVVRAVALAPIFFLPPFLLMPWTGHSHELLQLGPLPTIRADAWVAPWSLLLRGTACLLLGYGLVSSLAQEELEEAVSRLPLPRVFVVMVAESMRWLGPLIEESVNLGRAVSLRGAATGWRAGLTVARILPGAWLPRVAARASRVGNAMRMRGYTGQPRVATAQRWRFVDAIACGLCLVCLGIVIALRRLVP